jgi:SulP family sulfate permease
VLSSAAVVALGWDAVDQVGDVARIPRGLPFPVLPNLTLVPELIAPAISIAIIGLVQGAGISKAYPNPDGEYPNVSKDFTGQGAANAVAGLFQGMPLGGSVASSALNVSAGARSRWSNIFAGIIILVVVLLFSPVISLVTMPAMSALLIMAGVQSIKREEFLDVWDVGWGPRAVMMVTFAMTLAVPVQYAVFGGVILSVLVYLVSSSQDVTLSEIIPNPDGSYREAPAPEKLGSNAVTLLEVSGNLFYAAAYKLEELLPSAKESERPVVVLRLRQSDRIGSTFINVLEYYTAQLEGSGGKLILAGVNPRVKEQLDLTETTQEVLGEENVFLASENIRESTQRALEAAHAWLEDKTEDDDVPEVMEVR